MPDAEPAEFKREAALWRRPWLFFGSNVVLLLGLLAYVFLKDDPPPDDFDLLPTFPESRLNNPLTVFCREMKKHDLGDWKEFPEAMADLAREHEPQVRAYLGRHLVEQGLFDGLMRSDATGWQWPEVDASVSAETDFSYLTPCLQMVNLVQRSKVLLSDWAGRSEDACDEALKAARFGNGIIFADGTMIHHMIAYTAQTTAEALVRIPLLKSTDAVLLKKVQDALAPLDIPPSALARVLRVEYQFSRNSPNLDDAALDAMGFEGWDRVAVHYFTLPNRTRAEHAHRVRQVIEALGRDWTDALRVCDEISREIESQRSPRWKKFLKPNAGGTLVLAQSWSNAGHLVVSSCRAAALHRMTVVMLALRRYEMKHGSIPQKLEELVPEFLPAVPIDPFDGKPLRWQADTKWVYSVSRNGRDDGGRHGKPEKVGFVDPDLVMPYWWGAETGVKK